MARDCRWAYVIWEMPAKTSRRKTNNPPSSKISCVKRRWHRERERLRCKSTFSPIYRYGKAHRQTNGDGGYVLESPRKFRVTQPDWSIRNEGHGTSWFGPKS